MARKRRNRLHRGVATPPTRTIPGAAPDVLFSPFEESESGDSRRLGRFNLRSLPAVEAVDPRARPRFYSPVSLAKRAVGPLSSGSNRSVNLLRKLFAPRKVLFCVRRKARREVLFALRRVGYPGSSPGTRSKWTGKRYRRTDDSNYSCR